MIRLGVTGGIGSGKSTVAHYLARFCGGMVLDADAFSRESTAPAGAAIAKIAQVLGSEFIDHDGGLNRRVARQRAFSDPSFRRHLEAIIHPIVQAEMMRTELECSASGVPITIADIPLLVESGRHWRAHLDCILVVDCDEATQVHRVQSRNQIPPEEIKAIIAAQATRAQRLACADLVVCNDGISLTELGKLCQQVSTILRCKN